MGVKTGQGGFTFAQLRGIWQQAEELGFESAWLYDHFYSLSGKEQGCLEALTTLAALAMVTKRLRIGVKVLCNSYRPPGLLAKMVASIDVISRGRVEVGLGAGWYEEEFRAYGYAFEPNAVRIHQLGEAIRLCKMLWTQPRATFRGRYYGLEDAICEPKPEQKPHPPVWVGIIRGERLMPRLAAQLADGVNWMGSPEEVAKKAQTLRQCCDRIGRRFEDLRRSWQGSLIIHKSRQAVDAELQRLQQERGLSPDAVEQFRARNLVGTDQEVAAKLARYADAGITDVLPFIPTDGNLAGHQLLLEAVVPQI